MTEMRLQKFLSAAGVCSRRKGEQLIQSGAVRVNDRVVTTLGTKVDPDQDQVEYQGRVLSIVFREICIALHKPKGYVTTCEQKNRKIVLDLVDVPERVYPIGRLDKDSTGLLLLTNIGPLHQRLSHPSFDHEKEYDVTAASALSDFDLKQMASGMVILGRKTRTAGVTRMAKNRFRIVLQEGRNRQIRRMVEKRGNRVIRLKRIRMAGISLGSLKVGAWRYLSESEIRHLKKSTGISNRGGKDGQY